MTPARRSDAWLRAVLIVLAVGQVVSALLVQRYGGQFTTADRPGEPPIVPAGYAFSIWLVIEILALAYAVWPLPSDDASREVRRRLAVPLIVVFAGFSAWLAAAELEPVWSTLVVFAVMVVALLRAMQVALASRTLISQWGSGLRSVLWWLLGTYLGWSSAAIWINLTTAVADSGAPITGTVGTVGQLAILAGVTGTATVVVWWTRGLVPYMAAVSWGLVGAIVGASQADRPVLAAAAGTGLAVVIGVALWQRARRRQGAAVIADHESDPADREAGSGADRPSRREPA